YAHAGYTVHSLIPLLMSTYSGMGWRIYVQDYPNLPGTTMAQALRDEHGYRTAFLTSQDLDYQDVGRFLQNRGFDAVKDVRDFGAGRRLSGWGGDDRELIGGLLNWIDEQHQQPFYALAWTQQTHHP